MVIIITVVVFLLTLAACAPSGPQTFSVQVGSEDTTNGLEIDAFLPNYLQVNVGDTIIFSQKTHELHTITFNAPNPLPNVFLNQRMNTVIANPLVFLPSTAVKTTTTGSNISRSVKFDGSSYVNSGVLQTPGDSFAVTFSKQGTYQFNCLFHPASESGTVTVNPAGSGYYQGQSDITSGVNQALGEYFQSAANFSLNLSAPLVVENADGTHTYTVLAGLGDESQGFDFMYFFGGANLTIKVGDQVTWTVSKNTPGMIHTITFLSGSPEPDFIIPQSPSSSTSLSVNPQVANPSPSSPLPYSGSGYYNSGLLISNGIRQNYTLTFTKPGKYAYTCVPHDDMGMKGTITVNP